MPHPKGTLVSSLIYGYCPDGHVYITTSMPKRNKEYGSGYMQSATCLTCSKVVGYVDTGWWKQLASTEDKARAREVLELRIATLLCNIEMLEAA